MPANVAETDGDREREREGWKQLQGEREGVFGEGQGLHFNSEGPVEGGVDFTVSAPLCLSLCINISHIKKHSTAECILRDLAVNHRDFVLKRVNFSPRVFIFFRGMLGSLKIWDNAHTH